MFTASRMNGTSIPLHPKAKAAGFSARFVCLTGQPVKGGNSIRLALGQHRKVKRYATGEACPLKDWDADTGRVKPRAKHAAAVNRVLGALEAEVGAIVDALVVNGTLSFESFEQRYRKPKAKADVLAYMAEVVTELEGDGKQGNANTYRNTARVLARFTDGKALPFAELTPSKLEKLERNLREHGCGDASISVYMRTLRAVVGRAMKAGLLHPDAYPFETKMKPGYTMANLKGTSRPRSLSEADMEKLKAFPFDEAPHVAQSVRLFIFSYYARGMNFADIARLKRSDVYDGRIHYHRQKTGGEVRSIPLSDALAGLLTALEVQGGEYVLPILGPEHVTEKQKVLRIQKCLKRMNREMKEAAALVGIHTKLTSYVARHTYATTLKRKGTSDTLISEALGHASTNTTRAYLARFGSDVLDATDALL